MPNDEQVPGITGRGKELHREFVGMLFSLAIAQVAIQASVAVHSDAGWRECIPTYSHLALAACLIATSWVGWGWSSSSLSDIRTVFSRNFLELCVDLLLVGVYFFVTMGAELPDDNTDTVTPSLAEEAKWVPWVFGLYLVWDFLTKICDGNGEDGWQNRIGIFRQRAWGTGTCFLLALLAQWWFKRIPTQASQNVLIGDAALLTLVLLFRSMKAEDFSKMEKGNWLLVGCLFVAFLALVVAAPLL